MIFLPLFLGEQRFELATTDAGIGVWESAYDHKQSVWSESFFTLLGLKAGEIKPSLDSFLKFVHPKDQAMVEAIVRKSEEEAVAFNLECRIQRKDGSNFWVRITGKIVEIGITPRLFVSATVIPSCHF